MKKIIFITIICTLSSTYSFAQQNSNVIYGLVKTNDGRPLEGVTLSLKNSQTTVATNAAGHFNITAAVYPDTLKISHIGYRSKTIFVTRSTRGPLNIQLSPAPKQLHEVIVSTGYQKIPRERATGSFEQIDNQLLNQRAGSNILDRLEGVSSIFFDKHPNRPSISIRGFSTIHGLKSPLIILDNFPYEGNIENINPNDIKSVTLLKDAAAASIWGARAGNGVIVITTKQGNFNQPFTVSLNASLTIGQKPDLFYLNPISSKDFIDVEEYLFSKGYYENIEKNTSSRPPLTPVVELLIAARDGKISAEEAHKKIDQFRQEDVRSDFDRYMYQSSAEQQYTVNVGGGSDHIKYFISGGYDRNVDELASIYDRFTFRSSNTFKPVNDLKITTSVAYAQSKRQSGKPGYGNIPDLYPYAQLINSTGDAKALSLYRQTYIDTAGAGHLLDWNYYPFDDYKYDRKAITNREVIAGLNLNYHLTNNISLGFNYQFEQQSILTKEFHGIRSFYTRNLINKFSTIDWNTGTVEYNVPKGSILDRQRSKLSSHSGRIQFNYQYKWKRSHFTAVAGGEIRSIKNIGNGYRVYGYNPNNLQVANVDHVNRYTNYLNKRTTYIPSGLSETETLNHFISTYANAAYTYDGRYSVSASARRDASNLFGVNTNDKWTPLWSVGLKWNLSNENFYAFRPLSYLSIRATYGFSGNVDPHRSAVTTLYYIGRPARFTNLPNAIVHRFKNPDLKWEKDGMLNFGIDFSFARNLVTGSLEYYHKNGSNLLGQALVDYTAVPVATLIKNTASMTGEGIDIKINSKNIDRRFSWYTNVIFSYNRNQISEYYLDNKIGANYVGNGETFNPIEGKPLYSILSFKWAGLDKQGNPVGVINGHKSTDYAKIQYDSTTINDLVYSGPARPTVYGFLNNTLTWNNLSVTPCISYEFGSFFRKPSISYSMLFSNWEGNSDYAKRWKKKGDEAITNVPSMIYPVDGARDAFYNNAEVLVRKGGNIRLRYVNISYTINGGQLTHSSFKAIKIYLIASNLGILWKANDDNLDPNYIDRLPPSKHLTLGVNLTF